MKYSSSYRAMSTISEIAEGGATIGKILGPVGVVFGALATVEHAQHGETGLAILTGVSTALAAAALIPTPATPVLAAASAVVGVTSLIVEHHEEIAAAAKAAATTIASAAEPLARAVGGAVGKAGGLVTSIASKAANLWPWN